MRAAHRRDPASVAVPAALVEATIRREGEAGRAWTRELPGLIAGLTERWGCEVTGEPMHGQVAVVVPVRRREERAVLKVSFPHPGNRGEASGLRQFDGRGAVRLMDADDDRFALLLERAGPRTLVSEPSADAAIEIAGVLARRLAVVAEPGTPSLAATAEGWAEQLDGQVADRPGVVPADAVRRARETIAELGRDSTPTLLHGDLHAGNVLASGREPWLAIDPKGWRGTAVYDTFTVMAGSRRQLAGVRDLRASILARARRFAESAGVSTDLAIACCQARATSSLLHQDIAQGDWFDRELLVTTASLR